MPLKLKKITFDNAPKIPGVRAGDLGTIDCENPTEPLRGWRAVVKGALLVLVSPRGWMSGRPSRDWDKDGLYTYHEIPRSSCYLHWEGDEGALTELGKAYTSEPFGPKIEPAVESAPVKTYPMPTSPAEIGDL